MSFLSSMLPAIIVFGILIAIHEWGHFIACRLTGVNVEKFCIGFGPELIHWQGRETRYAICAFPLGGYVKPAGEESDEESDDPEKQPKPGDYQAANVWSRIFIVCAGVIMNYVLAFVLLVVIFLAGKPVPDPVIGSVREDYPAAEAGLQEGDRILEIAKTPLQEFAEVIDILAKVETKSVEILIERKDDAGKAETLIFEVEPKVEMMTDIFGDTAEQKYLGISPHPDFITHRRFGLLRSLKEAAYVEYQFTILTHKALFYLLIGKLSPKTMSGPIGIVMMSGEAAKSGITSLLYLMAILSISLAVINLLPIPALDGGHLVFLLWEAATRKKVSMRIQEKFTTVGFVLLMALMVFVFYNDIVNLNIVGKIKEFFS